MDEKTKRKRRPTQGKWILVIVVSGIFLLACTYSRMIGGWDDFLSEGGCIGEAPYQNDIINRVAKITLPDSTTNLEAYSESWQDCFVSLKFEIDADNAEAFYASTLVDKFEERRGEELTFDAWIEPENGWDFTSDMIYLYGEGSQDNLYQKIAIDTSNPERYIVYVTVLWM